uniref:HEAT repeat n=1 Tax=Candidatus Kentrum sp. LFY TaxID=2126342 RepID=A0A450UIS3_9GAMM|nr:MAG: HEAT repeat [Candidatus Kentron sp. LFY]
MSGLPGSQLQRTVPLKAEAIAALGSLASTGDEADRCHACRALGVLGDGSTVPVLSDRLRDEDIDVRVDAAEALGNIGDPDAVPVLLDSLTNEPDGDVKTAVVEALGKIPAPDVNPALLAIAKRRPKDMVFDDNEDWDPWWDMQLKSVEILGRLGLEEAVPVLEHVLQDTEGQDIESEVLAALARIGGVGEQAIARRIGSNKARERRRAVRALALARSESSLEIIGQALKDPSPDVRIAALSSLAERHAFPYLRAVLLFSKDPEPEVRVAAMQAATRLVETHGTSGDSEYKHQARIATADIIGLVTNPIPEIGEIALTVLAETDFIPDAAICKAVDVALASPNPGVAGAACAVVGQVMEKGRQWVRDDGSRQSPRAISIEVIDDPEHSASVRKEAILALGRSGQWDQETGRVLSRAVTDSERVVRFAALHVLARHSRNQEGTFGCPVGDQPSGSELAGGNLAETSGAEERMPVPRMAGRDMDGKRQPPDLSRDDNRLSVPSSALDIVIDALRGRLLLVNEPLSDEHQVAHPMDDDSHRENQTPNPPPAAHGSDTARQNPDARGDGESPPIMSTLEAIAKDSRAAGQDTRDPRTEGAVEAEETGAGAGDSNEPDDSDDSEAGREIREYLAMMRKRRADTEWLFRHGQVAVADDVRRLAARILGGSDGRGAIAALVETLDDPDTELVRTSVLALAAIANRDKTGSEKGFGHAPRSGAEPSSHSLCAFMASHAGPRLIGMLDNESRDLRLATVRALGAIGHDAIGLDAVGFNPMASDPVEKASPGSGIIGDRHAVVEIPLMDALLARLEDSDAAVRAEAIRSLSILACHPRCFERNDEEIPGGLFGSGRVGSGADTTRGTPRRIPREPAYRKNTFVGIEHLIERLKAMLQDTAAGVRVAAAREVVYLLQYIGKHQPILTQKGIPDTMNALIHAGLVSTGGEVPEIAQVMRELDPAQAATCVLARLDTLATSAERRFAIEMLEEILK